MLLLAQVLVCTDLWKDSETLHAAYCDSLGVTEAFILNGMKNAIAEASAGHLLIDLKKWEYEVIVNPDLHQVSHSTEAYYKVDYRLQHVESVIPEGHSLHTGSIMEVKKMSLSCSIFLLEANERKPEDTHRSD